MDLCFATNNPGKLKEIKALAEPRFRILSLADIGCREELPENQDTLEGNALEKASYVYNKYRVNCFADDTGLEVSALNGAPGVYSARYAGPSCSPEDNMNLLLEKMKGAADRTAVFRTCIALILDDKTHIFNGTVKGEILTEKSGSQGFGYDPIFKPEGFPGSFAEMSLEEKNKISHRGRAVESLMEFLRKYSG